MRAARSLLGMGGSATHMLRSPVCSRGVVSGQSGPPIGALHTVVVSGVYTKLVHAEQSQVPTHVCDMAPILAAGGRVDLGAVVNGLSEAVTVPDTSVDSVAKARLAPCLPLHHMLNIDPPPCASVGGVSPPWSRTKPR